MGRSPTRRGRKQGPASVRRGEGIEAPARLLVPLLPLARVYPPSPSDPLESRPPRRLVAPRRARGPAAGAPPGGRGEGGGGRGPGGPPPAGEAPPPPPPPPRGPPGGGTARRGRENNPSPPCPPRTRMRTESTNC